MLAPVPPLATATTPLTFAEFPAIFPVTLLPDMVAILTSVTEASAKSAVKIVSSNIFLEVIAPVAMEGAVALPARSPANWIFPVAVVVASADAMALMAVLTNSVVANLVELSVEVCVLAVVPVGKDGVPVNVGESKGAFKAKELVTSVAIALALKAVAVAELMGLSASEVLSTLDKPTIVLVIPPTVPVNIGDSMGAFKAKPGTVGEAAVPAKSPVN